MKVIDIALEYANDNYEADVLGTRRLGNAEHKATEAAQDRPRSERAAKLAKPDDP